MFASHDNDSLDPLRTFNGRLAQTAIYNRALATNEIIALYQAGMGSSYGPALANAWIGNQLVLSWPAGGNLLQSTNLTGPWNPNSTAPPLTVTPDQPQMFYRLK